MSQEALDFGRDHRVTEAQRQVLRTVNDAVDAIGLLVAAGACGCRSSELSDALAGRSNRHLRVEWVLAIADASPIDFKHRIAMALVSWMGFRADTIRPLSAAEKLAVLESRIAARFGQAGIELVEECKR